MGNKDGGPLDLEFQFGLAQFSISNRGVRLRPFYMGKMCESWLLGPVNCENGHFLQCSVFLLPTCSNYHLSFFQIFFHVPLIGKNWREPAKNMRFREMPSEQMCLVRREKMGDVNKCV